MSFFYSNFNLGKSIYIIFKIYDALPLNLPLATQAKIQAHALNNFALLMY